MNVPAPDWTFVRHRLPHVRQSHETEFARFAAHGELSRQRIEQANAFSIHGMDLELVAAGQQWVRDETHMRAVDVVSFQRRINVIHLAGDAVYGGAVRTRQADSDDGNAPVARMHAYAQTQFVALLDNDRQFSGFIVDAKIDKMKFLTLKPHVGAGFFNQTRRLAFLISKVGLRDIEDVAAGDDRAFLYPACLTAKLLHVIHAV